ncbi:MAG: HAD-IA family hydrolase [Kangiellaceae bacterium]|jgi:phosphoglycolate phosphatase|nr:HAD-IA family hydrolase [Kangiellaceae bacterium]
MSKMKNKRVIIFDWDGTLMDSTPRIVAAVQETARVIDLPIPNDAAIKHIIGLSLDTAFQRLFPRHFDDYADHLFKEYRYQYIDGDHVPTPLFDGIERLLKQLHSDQKQLSVATGKARRGLSRVIQGSQIESLFVDSICADEAESKPSAQMLDKLLDRNNWQASDCVMVGDTSHDINMAKNAGVESIAVSYGAHSYDYLVESKPTQIANSVSQLEELLLS